jgi:hypothetical protein
MKALRVSILRLYGQVFRENDIVEFSASGLYILCDYESSKDE